MVSEKQHDCSSRHGCLKQHYQLFNRNPKGWGFGGRVL
ncbi:hypothetical protein SLEP1_g864 [Rubroshorea leprosula]|uniref:Uncharacterized protein n=1 Tax=Rubroshorea leprosula TaxID=152421 RepID=A0AAV5HKP0_9ROSI|nr:hypothetical protein SLEP1_g864 [Rubroshorea leprosula]